MIDRPNFRLPGGLGTGSFERIQISEGRSQILIFNHIILFYLCKANMLYLTYRPDRRRWARTPFDAKRSGFGTHP
jgi:hypothetical protein